MIKGQLNSGIELEKKKVSLNDWIEFPALIKLLPEVNGKNILDLGCGTGETAMYLAKKGAKVFGVEASREMIKYCPKHKNIKYYNLHAEKISFKKEFFDIAVCEMLLDNIKNIEKPLKKIHYCLKKNGMLLISLPHPFRYSFNKKSWNDVKDLELIGYFDERKIESDWEGNKVIHYHKKLETIFNTLIKEGFKVIKFLEPEPLKGFKKINKDLFEYYSKIPFAILFKCVKSSQ